MFPDCNSSLNSPMAMKWCTTLEAAWERCPIVFQGHPSNCKVTQDQKMPILTLIECFRTVTPVWNQWWPWNDAQILMQYKRGALLFFKVIRQISRSRGQKIADFGPNCVFPDCNSSLDSRMALKWCTKLNVVKKRCPIAFQCHPSNFKVTGEKDRRFSPKLGFSGL